MDQESLQNQEQKPEIKYPDGFENWPLEDKEIFNNVKTKLENAGVKIEIVETQMNLAMYDEGEKTLRIRQDADAEFLNDYVENAVFKEQEGVDQLSQEKEEMEDIHLDDGDEEDEESEGDEDQVSGEEVAENVDQIPVPEPETLVVLEPLPTSEPAPVAQELSPVPREARWEEDLIPAWQRGEEWKEFEKLRTEKAKAYAAKKEIIAVEYDYNKQKNLVAQKIKETLRAQAGENLTLEQEAELKSKINDVLFDELVKKENDAYISALREARGETSMSKALEGARNILSTKAVKWYLGLSKKERMAVNFVVGSAAGLTFGATVAPGMVGVASYLAWRAARTALSGSAGAVAGEWANKKWSAEELAKNENEETEALKNSDLPLEEKSKGYEDIKKKYKKEKIKMAAKKIGVTVGAGAGTGFLTGLAEHAVMGTGAVAKSALETKGGKAGGLMENKLGSRKGFTPDTAKTTRPELESPQPKTPSHLSNEELNNLGPKPQVGDAPTEPVVPSTEKLFDDPNVLVHEISKEDSIRQILKETLENNKQFSGMSSAQKSYVLSNLTGKVFQQPENYGVANDQSITVGQKVDFTKLFEDTKQIKSLLDKAEQAIPEGSPQEMSIIENDEKIATWIAKNPNVKPTADKISEILSSKPKTEIPLESSQMPTTISGEPLQPLPSISETPFEHSSAPATLEVQMEPSPMPKTLGTDNLENIKSPKAPVASEMILGKKGPGAAEQLHQEISDAKNRLAQLENSNSGRNPNLERSLLSDSKFTQSVESAFRNEIDNIYGKKGLFGLGKIAGVNSKEWGEMARLPASKVVEYYTGDSTQSGLTPRIIEVLTKSKSHQALMKQVAGLMEQSNGAVKPFENENVEQFIKRLGGYVFKNNLQNLPKAV